jgi:ABC-2 type transport system permease protein
VPEESARIARPLWVLMRANSRQGWRRLKSIHSTSAPIALTMAFFIVAYLGVSFVLFHHGLRFLYNFPALGSVLIERLFFLLFVFLLVLLVFSNLVIGYSNFFRNRETSFLMSLPIPAQTIYRWKFIESALLASWAFVFLIAPLLAAYGMMRGAPWHFYLMTVGALAMFIVLPSVAGGWAAMALARYLDRRSFQVAAVILTLAILTLMVIWFRPETLTDNSTDPRVLATLDKLLMRTHFSESAWLPSFWLSTSVLQWSEGAWTAAGFFLLVLLSNVLFFGWICFNFSGGLFYEAFSTVQSRAGIFARWTWFRRWRRRHVHLDYGPGPVEKFFGVTHKETPDVLALLVKDARMFWRDTTQWGQTLVLFGLLAVYVINLRHFSQELTNHFWLHLVSYLNLGACSLNLATLTTRFVFPQFSLEGKRLWIVGMAPMGLVRALEAKFWLASRAALPVAVGLIFLSCHMLQISLDRTLYFALIIAIMSFTLAALAMGLGALFPNFREDNPTKIVSGFGGTLCLVLSFLYIVGSVTLLAAGSRWVWGSWTGFVGFSVMIGWVPYRMGLRRAKIFEM